MCSLQDVSSRGDHYSLGRVMEYMAEATRCKWLGRLGAACACDDMAQRPDDISHIRLLLNGGNRHLAIVNAVLAVVAIALAIVVGMMLYGRSSAADGGAPSDSASQYGGNSVVSSDHWQQQQ